MAQSCAEPARRLWIPRRTRQWEELGATDRGVHRSHGGRRAHAFTELVPTAAASSGRACPMAVESMEWIPWRTRQWEELGATDRGGHRSHGGRHAHALTELVSAAAASSGRACPVAVEPMEDETVGETTQHSWILPDPVRALPLAGVDDSDRPKRQCRKKRFHSAGGMRDGGGRPMKEATRQPRGSWKEVLHRTVFSRCTRRLF
jgi:hypothetical protein